MGNAADRVRQAIEDTGLSHAEFARQVGLDGPKLSKSLSGVRRFSSLDLARIGDLTGRSVEWLLGGDEPPLAVAARATHGSVAATATDAALELVTIRRSLSDLGFPQRLTLPAVPAFTGLDYVQGERLADVALAHVSAAGIDGIHDLAGAIEAAFGIEVAIRPLGDGFDGLAVATSQAKLILAAPSGVPSRQRFTLAHELGHLLAGDNQELHLDEDIFGAQSRTAGSERRANAFAAAFLMPEGALRDAVGSSGLDDVGFCQLAMDLEVSPSALAFRLKSLDLIDGMAHARFKGIPGKRAAALCGAEALLVEQAGRSRAQRPPGLLARDAFAAYEQGLTTIRLYARVLDEPDAERLRASLEGAADAPPRRRPSVAEMRSFLNDEVKAPL